MLYGFAILFNMLAIKLQRIGKKHQPSYRLVVAEKRSKMAAPPVEDLGAYNPSSKVTTFDNDRILHWIKMGAQPTPTVHNLLVEQKISGTPKMAIKMKKRESVPASAEVAAGTPSAAPQEA